MNLYNLSRFSRHLFAVIVIGFGIVIGPGHAVAQDRPMGTDVSSYQGGSLNWTTIKNDGIFFAWAKAAEGTSTDGWVGEDPDFTINEANAKAAGVLIGAYYFAHPETDTGTAGADTEAAFFWSVAGPYITTGGAYLMPMLDMEESYGGVTAMSDWVNEWCQDIVNYAAAKGVVVKPAVYSSTSFASDNFNSTVTQWTPWLADYPERGVWRRRQPVSADLRSQQHHSVEHLEPLAVRRHQLVGRRFGCIQRHNQSVLADFPHRQHQRADAKRAGGGDGLLESGLKVCLPWQRRHRQLGHCHHQLVVQRNFECRLFHGGR